MKSKTITYFDWSDIKKEICKEMKIAEIYFRDYHKKIGGDYKDLWHEWMEYFSSEIRNGDIHQFDLGECIESKIEWIRQDEKEWLEPFVKAVYKVCDKYNIKNIKYSW